MTIKTKKTSETPSNHELIARCLVTTMQQSCVANACSVCIIRTVGGFWLISLTPYPIYSLIDVFSSSSSIRIYLSVMFVSLIHVFWNEAEAAFLSRCADSSPPISFRFQNMRLTMILRQCLIRNFKFSIPKMAGIVLRYLRLLAFTGSKMCDITKTLHIPGHATCLQAEGYLRYWYMYYQNKIKLQLRHQIHHASNYRKHRILFGQCPTAYASLYVAGTISAYSFAVLSDKYNFKLGRMWFIISPHAI